VEGAGTHLDIIGLQNRAALIRPVVLEREDEALKAGVGGHLKSVLPQRGISAGR
jgi:hypothetical protein